MHIARPVVAGSVPHRRNPWYSEVTTGLCLHKAPYCCFTMYNAASAPSPGCKPMQFGRIG